MWLVDIVCNEKLMLCGFGSGVGKRAVGCWSSFVLIWLNLENVYILQLAIPINICPIKLFFPNHATDSNRDKDRRLELHVSLSLSLSFLGLSILIAFIFRMKKWYIKVVGPAWLPGELCLIIYEAAYTPLLSSLQMVEQKERGGEKQRANGKRDREREQWGWDVLSPFHTCSLGPWNVQEKFLA